MGAISPRSPIRMAPRYAENGADAVMAIPPVSVTVLESELMRYYQRIIRSIDIPVIVLTVGRRHILQGGDHPLADLAAASSAVPGLLPPHRVAGRLYAEGPNVRLPVRPAQRRRSQWHE